MVAIVRRWGVKGKEDEGDEGGRKKEEGGREIERRKGKKSEFAGKLRRKGGSHEQQER
jgi:hypothetical protein